MRASPSHAQRIYVASRRLRAGAHTVFTRPAARGGTRKRRGAVFATAGPTAFRVGGGPSPSPSVALSDFGWFFWYFRNLRQRCPSWGTSPTGLAYPTTSDSFSLFSLVLVLLCVAPLRGCAVEWIGCSPDGLEKAAAWIPHAPLKHNRRGLDCDNKIRWFGSTRQFGKVQQFGRTQPPYKLRQSWFAQSFPTRRLLLKY